MTNEQRKDWIDQASYEELLRKWRNSPTGDVWFAGEIGDYYAIRMKDKRSAITEEEAISASKRVGW